MLRILGVVGGFIAGAVTGGWAGAQYYILFGPPYGQYGYEFEGAIETVVGVGVGAVLGAIGGAVLAMWWRRPSRDPSHTPRNRVLAGVGWLALYACTAAVALGVLTPAAQLGWDRGSEQARFVRALIVGLVVCLAVWVATRTKGRRRQSRP